VNQIEYYTDSNFAGDRKSTRSHSAFIKTVKIHPCSLRYSETASKTVLLSPAHAEIYALE
jgi:hypothetical protein